MDFSKTYNNVKSKKRLEFNFPAESVFSFPVAIKRDEALYDGFFAYMINSDGQTAARPFGWVVLSAATGEVCSVSRCAAADFVNPVEYPLDSVISLELPRPMEPARQKAMREELLSTYCALREFAFAEGLNRDQVAAIVRYKDLFMQLCQRGMYPFYHAVSPAFFHWLRLPLPERTGPASPPEEIQSDTRVYQHQLLILESLQQLVKQFTEKIAADGYREKLFDSLHKEAQEYKNGLLESLTRHMELDIIRIIDGLVKTLEFYRDKPRDEESCRKLYSLLEGVETDLRDILYRQGADPFSVPGGEVDVSRQSIVSTEKTGDRELDRRLAARMAEGWEKGGRIIRPERVSVYLFSGE